ncbi:hypothetical protein AKJ65_00325 [candidate division MSBL1 archaeon SCGC-AAA259E19]|uniref:Uncharacterized protein n=1 Tax=candidate division MSBL1 archaeon SCGC-AAA259E19 TaxID=1698264 RepID=A0A133UNR3_9EURY|nr:hypothetical protein AKJ65_00325 [candidate division MSBL1 archaeon SCGC-AAA259E19]
MPRMSPGETSLKVLSYLSKKNLRDEVTKYRVWKDCEQLSRSTVYDVIGELRAKGLVRRKGAGKAPTGQKKYYFALTLDGLLTAMYLDKRLWSDIDKIASKQVKVLPLVFGKWSVLMGNGAVKGILLPELKTLFGIVWRRLVGPAQEILSEPKESESPPKTISLRRYIYERLITAERFEEEREEARRGFAEAVNNDSELSEFVLQLSKIKAPLYERKASNHRALIDSVETDSPEDFADSPFLKRGERESEYSLFSREAKGAEEDLERDNISEQIRDIFRSEYCPLSEGSVHIIKKEGYWEIPRRASPALFAKVEDGKLNVFGSAKAKLEMLILRLEERVLEKRREGEL